MKNQPQKAKSDVLPSVYIQITEYRTSEYIEVMKNSVADESFETFKKLIKVDSISRTQQVLLFDLLTSQKVTVNMNLDEIEIIHHKTKLKLPISHWKSLYQLVNFLIKEAEEIKEFDNQ